MNVDQERLRLGVLHSWDIINYRFNYRLLDITVHTPVWEFPSLVHEGEFVK